MKENFVMSEIEYLPANHGKVEGDLIQSQPSIEMAAPKVTKTSIITLLVIVYINLLNYMDRFTVSSKFS